MKVSRQLPFTQTVQCPLRSPPSECRRHPGTSICQGADAASSANSWRASFAACAGWIPDFFPPRKNNSMPLCLKSLIAIRTIVFRIATRYNSLSVHLRASFVQPRAVYLSKSPGAQAVQPLCGQRLWRMRPDRLPGLHRQLRDAANQRRHPRPDPQQDL